MFAFSQTKSMNISFMKKKQVDNLENVIPFDAETRETMGEGAEFAVEMPFEAFDRLVQTVGLSHQ